MEYSGSFDLPRHYDDNKVVLMVRDPRTIYAYWEIREDIEDEVMGKMRKKGQDVSRNVLRVYDVTENNPDQDPKVVFEFELKDRANNWYIHVTQPGREWMADIGILSTTGEFFGLARSNAVRSPADDALYLSDREDVTSGMFDGAGLSRDEE